MELNTRNVALEVLRGLVLWLFAATIIYVYFHASVAIGKTQWAQHLNQDAKCLLTTGELHLEGGQR